MYYPGKTLNEDCIFTKKELNAAFYDGYITAVLNTPSELHLLTFEEKIELCKEALEKGKFLNQEY